MARPLARGKQRADEKAKKRAHANTQDQAAQRRTAQEGRKDFVQRHHIIGGGLVKAGEAKEEAHGGGRAHAKEAARDEDGQVGYGDGDGLDVDIPQERKGHQEFKGRQRREENEYDLLPVERATTSLADKFAGFKFDEE